MRDSTNADPNAPVMVAQFYHTYAFPHLINKWQDEIRRRLKDVPVTLRQQNLVPALENLDEVSGDTAHQIFRNYLDEIEAGIADIVGRHSPSFWFHLYRRLRPMLAKVCLTSAPMGQTSGIA